MNRRAATCRSFQRKLFLGTACPVLCNELTGSGGELQPEARHSFCGRWEIVRSFRERGCAVQPNDYDKIRRMRDRSHNQKFQPISKSRATLGFKINMEICGRSSKWCPEAGIGGRERKRMGCTELCVASS